MSLFNISATVNNDSDVREAADAEKEFQALQASRKRMSLGKLDLRQTSIDTNSPRSAPGHRRSASTTQDHFNQNAPQFPTGSHRRTQSATIPSPTISRSNTLDVSSPRHSMHSKPMPKPQSAAPKPSGIYQADCEYKKPTTALTAMRMRNIDFKPRFIVIDTKFKFMRIYRNQGERRKGQPFKYELPLTDITITHSNIKQRKQCIIVRIKAQEHAFYFHSDEQREKALEFMEICAGMRVPHKVAVEFCDSLSSYIFKSSP